MTSATFCHLVTWSLCQLGTDPTFTVLTADNHSHRGQFTKIGADWSLRLTGEAPILLPGQNVIQVRRQSASRPAFPSGPQVVLGNGDRLPFRAGSVPEISGEQLRVTTQPPLHGDSLQLPLGAVALVWFSNPEPGIAGEIVLRRLLEGERRADLILLRNGDQIEGAVTKLDKAGCNVEVRQRPQTVPSAQLAAIAFRSDVLIRAAPRTLHGHLTLDGGARLTLASASVDETGKFLIGTPTFRGTIKVPLTGVAGLTLLRGRAVYLSELTPSKVTERPFLGVGWPPVRDGSVVGDSLQIGGQIFDRGLGLHSGTRVSYQLEGKYQRFQAKVGLDSRTGRLGRVRVQVLVDGKAVDVFPQDRDLMSRDVVRVDIPVAGARELTLVVQPGATGEIQGHVNWGEARLLQGPKKP